MKSSNSEWMTSVEFLAVSRAAFLVSLVALTWWGMLAIHELGHVAFALKTGGRIVFVELPALGISSTWVEPNPQPLLVAWGGPIVGALAPAVFECALGRLMKPLPRWVAGIFAGFCLLVNGGYLLAGTPGRIGDLQPILDNGGLPIGTVLLGIAGILAGLWRWHGLGSRLGWSEIQPLITIKVAWTAVTCAVLVAATLSIVSPIRFQ